MVIGGGGLRLIKPIGVCKCSGIGNGGLGRVSGVGIFSVGRESTIISG